ncbi:MAG: hypothetical protein HOW73_14000 [Polyangiaceae bacterium]|nr:hypothetical protein [Polyangiaceae bacterium]
MTAQIAGRHSDSGVTTRGARGEDIIAFGLLALAMILFFAWPKGPPPRVNRSKGHREPEGPHHPYRRAAPREPSSRTWIWKVPRRDNNDDA